MEDTAPAQPVQAEHIPASTTRDVRLIERAMRERWPMTAEVRKRSIRTALCILYGLDDKGKPRTKMPPDRARLSAFRALLAADNLNLAAEKEVLPQQHVHLHQGIDFDSIPMDDLKQMEAQLLALAGKHATEG